jgi:hypothetical protein
MTILFLIILLNQHAVDNHYKHRPQYTNYFIYTVFFLFLDGYRLILKLFGRNSEHFFQSEFEQQLNDLNVNYKEVKNDFKEIIFDASKELDISQQD